MKTNQHHQHFLASSRPHVYMLTVHGVHEWNVVPGLRDTGGQNVFVNQFSNALAKQGYKITIINRGGYLHPRSGAVQSGLDYRDSQQRILYLDDGLASFVRKEDMGDRLPDLSSALTNFLHSEGEKVDLIISHYWDGGMLGSIIKQEIGPGVKHIWVPHSLGLVKKRNLPTKSWKDLRIPFRIEKEKEIFRQVDYVAATSSIIRDSASGEYDYQGKFLWLPPCVDQERYFPRVVEDDDQIWSLLGDLVGLPWKEIQSKRIILEISRTDRTKQKDILIQAFSRLLKKHPEALLVISIDRNNTPLGQELMDLIARLGIEHAVAVVGSIWEQLPALYAVTEVYCTPSIMEGFGMSVQEAAATRVPVISSDLVPFVTEYLVEKSHSVSQEGGSAVFVGDGAIVVPSRDIEGFAFALDLLLSDDKLRKKMGQRAYRTTIPYFTWNHIVSDFVEEIGFED